MHHRILTTVLALKAPIPTPSAYKPPPPAPPSTPTIWSILFGSGLISVLLVLVTLALLGVIAWIIWMLVTGRLITAQAASSAPSIKSRSPGAVRMENQLLTDQTWVPATNYPPDQNAIPPRHIMPLQEEPLPPSTLPKVEDPLDNKRWVGLAQGCVNLFDELDGLFPAPDPRQETANHVMYRLREILSRSGVEIIFYDRTYNVYRHQLELPNTETRNGTPIKIVSPGFAIGRLVLRLARVQVANSPVENVEKNR
jgi:hypothetical protein